jgi:hypothetical protein
MASTKRRWRGDATDGSDVLSEDLFAAMLELRARDPDAFHALLAFAGRVADLAER